MRVKITEKVLNRLQPGQQVSDSVAIGLSARRQTSGAVTFSLRYRVRGSARALIIPIGRWQSPWSPEDARIEAQRLLSEAAQGRDPVQTKAAAGVAAMTVGSLVAEYIEAMTSGRLLTKSGRPKAASTIACDTARLRLHVLPTLGKIALSELTKGDCEKLMHAIADGSTTRRTGKPMANSARGGKGAAARTLSLFSAVLVWGVDRGCLVASPCRGIRKFAGNKKTRRLSDAEYAKLGQALASPPATVPAGAVATVKFLCLSGWRCSEAVMLRLEEIEGRTASLGSTKTGQSVRPLASAAVALLAPGDSGMAFPPIRRGDPRAQFRTNFNRLIRAAGLPKDVTPHVLRHSFASVGADLLMSELALAAMLGHKSQSMTSRYSHLASGVLLQATDRVADKIQSLMDPAPEVAPARQRVRPDPAVVAIHQAELVQAA
jgi:integrase